MGPTRDDIDGLSLFREAFVSAEDVALSGRSLSGYYVARIQVQEILNIGLSVIPDPQTELPGHSLIPELNTARKKTDKNAVKEFQVQLADLASRDIIYTPISK